MYCQTISHTIVSKFRTLFNFIFLTVKFFHSGRGLMAATGGMGSGCCIGAIAGPVSSFSRSRVFLVRGARGGGGGGGGGGGACCCCWAMEAL